MSHNHFDTQSNIETQGSRHWTWIIGGFGMLLILGIVFLTPGCLPLPPQDPSTPTSSSGYIPEVGLVDTSSPIRVLRQPVAVERDGITVNVKQGFVDAEHLVLLLEVSGFYPAGDRDEMPACQGTPQLQLSGGGSLAQTGVAGGATGNGWNTGDGYSYRLIFPPFSPDIDVVTLEIPCLIQIQPGNWPQNWQIPLEFEIDDDLEVAPVVELPKKGSLEIPLTASPVEEIPESDFGIQLVLDQYAELETGYILMGKISWTSPEINAFGVMYQDMILTDSTGMKIPFVEIPSNVFPEPGEKWIPWNYQIDGKNFDWPLTLTLEAVNVSIGLAEPVTFQFDAGDDPKTGQTWDLNLDLQIGNYRLKVISAKAVKQYDNVGYKFTMQSEDKIVMARVMDLQNPGMSGGGGVMPEAGPFMATLLYENTLPIGITPVSVTDVTLLDEGVWQVDWNPGKQK